MVLKELAVLFRVLGEVLLAAVASWLRLRGRCWMRRVCDGTESGIAADHDVKGGTHMVVNVVTLQPPASCAAVKAAAARLQARHAHLRAVLVVYRQRLFFDARCGDNVEVREYSCSVDEATHRELHEPFESRRCCWRLAVCQDRLLLSYHHSLMDGISVMTVLQDLLTELGDGVHSQPPVEVGGIPPRIKETLPWYKPLTALARHPKPLKTTAIPRAEASFVPVEKCHVMWVERTAPVELTAALVQRCRAEGTTFQGALAAALLEGLKGEIKGTMPVGIVTFVNCRPSAGRDPRSLGCCVGILEHKMAIDQPFWELARRYKAQVNDLLHDEIHLLLPLLPNFLKYEDFLLGVKRGLFFDKAVGISNRGNFSLESGGRRATGLRFVRQMRDGGPQPFFTLNAVTVNGILCLTLNFISPYCRESRAAAVADGVIAALSAAAVGTA